MQHKSTETSHPKPLINTHDTCLHANIRFCDYNIYYTFCNWFLLPFVQQRHARELAQHNFSFTAWHYGPKNTLNTSHSPANSTERVKINKWPVMITKYLKNMRLAGSKILACYHEHSGSPLLVFRFRVIRVNITLRCFHCSLRDCIRFFDVKNHVLFTI